MKRFMMAAASLMALAAVPAHAGDIRIGFYSAPPVVYRPAPMAYYAPVHYYTPVRHHYAPRMAYGRHPHHFKGGYRTAYYAQPRHGHWR